MATDQEIARARQEELAKSSGYANYEEMKIAENAIMAAEAEAGRRATEEELRTAREELQRQILEQKTKAEEEAVRMSYEQAKAEKAGYEAQGLKVELTGKAGGEYTITGAPQTVIELNKPLPPDFGKIETATYTPSTNVFISEGAKYKEAERISKEAKQAGIKTETKTWAGMKESYVISPEGLKIPVIQKSGERSSDYASRVANVQAGLISSIKGKKAISETESLISGADIVKVGGKEVSKEVARGFIEEEYVKPLKSYESGLKEYAIESSAYTRNIPQGKLKANKQISLPTPFGEILAPSDFKSGADVLHYGIQVVGTALGITETPLFEIVSDVAPSLLAGTEEAVKWVGTQAYAGIKGISSIKLKDKGINNYSYSNIARLNSITINKEGGINEKGITWGEETILPSLKYFEEKTIKPFYEVYKPEEYITTSILGGIARFAGQWIGQEALLGPAETFLWSAGIKGLKAIKTAIKMRGKAYIPPEEIFSPSTLGVKSTLEYTTSTGETMQDFYAGSQEFVHASPKSIKSTMVIKPSSGPQYYGLEDIGLYGAALGKGQSYFTYAAQEAGESIIKRSFNPFKVLSSLKEELAGEPSVTIIQTMGAKRYPISVLEEPGFRAVSEFAEEFAGEGKAFVTKRSTLGVGELERQYMPVIRPEGYPETVIGFKTAKSVSVRRAGEIIKTNFVRFGDEVMEKGTTEHELILGVGTRFDKPELTGYTIVRGKKVGVYKAGVSPKEVSDLIKPSSDLIKVSTIKMAGEKYVSLPSLEDYSDRLFTKSTIYSPYVPIPVSLDIGLSNEYYQEPSYSTKGLLKATIKPSYYNKREGYDGYDISRVSIITPDYKPQRMPDYKTTIPPEYRLPRIPEYKPPIIQEYDLPTPPEYRPPIISEYRPPIIPEYRPPRAPTIVPTIKGTILSPYVPTKERKLKPIKKGKRKTRYEVSYTAAMYGITGEEPSGITERTLGIRPIIIKGKVKKEKMINNNPMEQTIKW